MALLSLSSLRAERHDPGRRNLPGSLEPEELTPAAQDLYEPNDSPQNAARLVWAEPGAEGWVEVVARDASVDNPFDFDFFRVELAAGDSLVASLADLDLDDPPLNPLLSILDAAGTVLAYNSDNDISVSVAAGSAGGFYVLVNDRAVLSGGSFGALENGRSYVLVLRQLRRSGDVDGSGSVDYRDAFYVYMLASGLVDTLTVSPAWRRAADVDEDGAVAGDMDDFRLIFDMVSSIPGRDPRSAAKSKDESSGPLLAGSAGSLRIEFPDGSLLEAAGDGWPQAIPAGSLASGFLESSLKLTSPAPGLVKLPAAATLAQNQPNPFNPSTTISFSLAREGRASLAVYDLRGRLVKVLASGNRAAGSHTRTWDGADSNGRRLASGIYVYRLIAGETILTRKMVLVK